MNNQQFKKNVKNVSKRSGLYLISIITLFVSIGILTTVQPAYRLSSSLITEWTRDIDTSVFYSLFGMENRVFAEATMDDLELPGISEVMFEIATNLEPDDPRSLLGNELPGFSIYDNQILIAGEGTDYTNFPVESTPPLEEVLKDREAIEAEDIEEVEKDTEVESEKTTGDKDVVYLYNSHNRESFLPYLPGVTDPDQAHHSEMNITKVSDRLAESLEQKGIGTAVDKTDIGAVLDEKGMEYWQSYDASREVVQEAFAASKDIKFAFDLHRDSIRKDQTTKEINGEPYAKIIFVVGEDYEGYEKNLEMASELHYLIEEKYPGLSRGVLTKGGSGTNGVFNQDLSDRALLIEFGGVDNTMEELYRSADVVAEVFSEYYWDAEAVQSNP